MNINHFSYFIETVRENSITRAAESLFISQSTISKAIKIWNRRIIRNSSIERPVSLN